MPVSCVSARRANAVLKLNPNKTDDNDAEMLAGMARHQLVSQTATLTTTCAVCHEA